MVKTKNFKRTASLAEWLQVRLPGKGFRFHVTFKAKTDFGNMVNLRKYGGVSPPCLGKHVKALDLRLTSLRSCRSTVQSVLESEGTETTPGWTFN
uniref:SFRICE_028884 n=1 Tax=Spodoptera frugiperda TaxID=7108 RepID=A0A2H1WZN9_SPOFR